MILKKLKLENIRSYKEATVDFPLGKTLFEGDIGSGKSTILMAIEFALFGLGSEKGAALLRSGENEGKVGLIFEVDGKEYMILRNLSREGTRIQQNEGMLKAPEGVLHLSPTELKERILQILNFNEPPDPKAQSIIYRYAVFTPQEEMKAILFLRPDLRLQTLRKAFRIEDYKVASENAKELSKAVELNASELEFAASDMPGMRKRIGDLAGQIDSKQKEFEALGAIESETDKSLAGLRNEKERLHIEEVELSKSTADVAHLDKFIKDKNGEIEDAKEEIKGLGDKLGRLESKAQELEAIMKPTDKSQEGLKREIGELEKEEKQLRKIETQIESKMNDYKSIQESGNCPTCDRPADSTEFGEKIISKVSEKESASGKVEECTKLLEGAKELLEKRKLYDDAQGKLNEYRKQVDEYIEEIEKQNGKILTDQEKTKEATEKLEAARKNLERLKEVSGEGKQLENEIGRVDKELRKIREDITAAETSIKNWKNEIKGYEEQIKKKENQKAKSEILKDYRIWIDDYFIPTLETIERYVMLNINQDFNAQFQKWFGMLVEDPGKEARVDEDFTPIVGQDGYEQDINYLSGGEKTSVALAYRLALNNIVQKVSTGMQSNLLILDEPTDGFSKEQLAKVREILDEVQSPQVVIVSHEKELESFADQIFTVVKSHGESKIISGS